MINYKDLMDNIDKKFEGTDKFLGKNVLTLANFNDSSRAIMNAGQLDQTVNLINPESAHMYTNYENIVGKYSSAYYESENDYIVLDKIPKFADNENHIYTLIVYDKKKKMYDVIQKQIGEILTEGFGYKYDNNVLDSKQIGDKINKGEVLFKSTSFDENMNYRYGINAKTMYLIMHETTEDALVISKSLKKKLDSVKILPIKISLNDNDILANIYGDTKQYKSFPDINEKIKNSVVACKKRIDYAQSLYDLKTESLSQINYMDDTIYYENGKIVDINIYCNKDIDEIEENPYNAQLIYYLKMDRIYREAIVYKLGKIIESGAKCSSDLLYNYKLALDILNPEVKWKDSNNSNFSNIILELNVMHVSEVTIGSKICGRYGDKGVVSKIMSDDDMPYNENGEKVEMICNLLGVPNRINPSQLYEVEINFLKRRAIIERINEFNNNDDKINHICKFISFFNVYNSNEIKSFYDKLKSNEKSKFIESIIENNVPINIEPFYNNLSLDLISKIYDFYNVELYTCYVNKFNRKIKMMNKCVIGEKYILKLKHHPKSKLSMRSTSYLNSKDLPSKSYANKNNKSLYQKTPIRFGEMEYMNLMSNMMVDVLKEMSMVYSSSTKARRATGKLYVDNVLDLDDVEVPEDATNRNAEILNVYLRNIGVEIDFDAEDDEDEIDLENIEEDED